MSDQRSEISDEEYIITQEIIGIYRELLVEPDGPFGNLDAFIERAERSLAFGPVFHPQAFIDGASKLEEVLAHARALRTARNLIAKASTR